MTRSADTRRWVINVAASRTLSRPVMVIGAVRTMSRTRVRRIAEPASWARTDAMAVLILPACWSR